MTVFGPGGDSLQHMHEHHLSNDDRGRHVTLAASHRVVIMMMIDGHAYYKPLVVS